ncbi:MAG: GNAT family N-acetyltransferase [Bellilinea sp.]
MIKLQSMSPAEFQVYLERSVAEYADDKVKAGNWSQEGALERSRQEFNKYLPQGLDTPANFLRTLIDPETETQVGMIWYAPLPGSTDSTWFIYDFYVNPEQRRHGYGAQALAALEDHARAQGIKAIALHVFGHNTIARALYEKMGYEITNINMVKRVEQG